MLAVALLVAGCGTLRMQPARTLAALPRQVALSAWPTAADYGTIRVAVAVRNEALFREREWQRRSFAASLAARTLLTVRVARGRCADFVAQLYGNLRDLMDARQGEDWRPLIRLVRQQPSLAAACRRPKVRLAA